MLQPNVPTGINRSDDNDNNFFYNNDDPILLFNQAI